MTALEISEIVAHAMDSKKGWNIRGICIRDLTVLADYFVLCQAGSEIQARTISDEVEHQLGEQGVPVRGMEGYYGNTNWILMDYGVVMVHIFYGEENDYENLCHLWADGQAVSLI